MWIDIFFLICLLLAYRRGSRHGLIVAVFSAAAVIVGLIAAVKLSAAVAGWLKDSMHLTTRWLPVLAFLLVFAGISMLVRWGGHKAEEAIGLTMLGWVNRMGGIIMYVALYTFVLSIFLFYALQIHLISASTASASVTYPFIRPWGPAVIDELGKFVPFFKDMFAQLEDYFGHATRHATPK
jgi:membrane protein required for colicin V production